MHCTQSKAILTVGATILIVGTSTLLWNQPYYASKLSSLHFSTTETHPVTFAQKPEFRDLSSKGDPRWASLLPPNGGFMSRPSQNALGDEVVGIAMFHQLQCLQTLRGTIQDLMAETAQDSQADDDTDRETRLAMLKHQHSDNFGVRKRSVAHPDQDRWVYCLDYLMQSVLCAADDTLEFAREDVEGRRVANGYGVTHQCRNADHVWEMAMGKQSRPGWTPATDLKP